MIKRFDLSNRLEICILLYLFIFSKLFSQSDTSSTTKNDTIIYHTPIRLLGTFYPERDVYTKHILPFGDNVSAFEIIERASEQKFLTLGAIGNTPYTIEYGFVFRPSIYSNGRIHRQLPDQASSFEFFPLLAIENIEIFKGSEAIARSGNSNGLLFNFTSRILNAKYPYTQIWIGQAGYEYLGSSGLFSQNIFPNLNFFLLYQRYWSAGRYTNSNADRWNLLAGVRWYFKNNLNFLFQNQYTIVNNGLYGGLNPEKSISLFDNTFSVPNFEKLNRIVRQNDFSINYTYLASPDTAIVISGGCIFSYAKNDIDLDKFLSKNGEETEKTEPKMISVDTKVRIKSHKFDFLFGTEIQKNWLEKSLLAEKNDDFIPSLFAITKTNLGSKIKLTLAGRVDKLPETFGFSAGSKLGYSLDSATEFYADLSYKATGNGELYKNCFLAIFGNEILKADFRLTAEVFARFARDYSIYNIIPDSTGNIVGVSKIYSQNINFLGANVSVSIPFLFGSRFYTKSNINYATDNGKSKEWLPLLVSKSGISYKYTRGASSLDIGLEFELLSQFKGLYIVPFFCYPVEYNKERTSWQTNGLNLFASAKLGNAYLNLSVRNILSTNFYYLPIYPEYDRSIRITVFWSFND